MRRNFEHSCDQVTFKMLPSNAYHNSNGNRSHPNVLSYRWFLTKVITIDSRNTMASSYHSKVRSTQNKGATFLFCLEHGWSQKISTVDTDLINFVGVQRFHQNIKWIMCFQRDLPTLCLQKRHCSSAFPY